MSTDTETQPVDPISMPEDERKQIVLNILFGGKHHVPKIVIDEDQWLVMTGFELSSFDNSDLTKLVLAAHHFGVRATLRGVDSGMIQISVSAREGRDPDGMPWDIHPTIEQARNKMGL